MRLESLDWLGPKVATICGAAAGSVGTALAMAADAAMQLFGVPLPVVLGSAAGAGIARSMLDPVPFWRALFVTAAWTVAGCVGAPLAQALLGKAGIALDLTTNVLAGLGIAIASAQWWVPKVWPMVMERLSKREEGGKP